MVDINAEAEKTLSELPYTLCFYYPEQWNTFPIVSFYNLTESGAFASDNEEDIQKGTVVVDIWALSPSECGKINIEITELMKSDGWCRETSMDVPKTDGVYHRTMRFSKIFINQED